MFGTPRNVNLLATSDNIGNQADIINNSEPTINNQQNILGDETSIFIDIDEPQNSNQYEVYEDSHIDINKIEEQEVVDKDMDEIYKDELFIETTYQESVNSNPKDVSSIYTLITRPMALGKIILSLIMVLVGISIVLKVFIEIKKQHYKNVIFALLILFALGLIYLMLDQRMTQVVLI
jgi:hypothetical protein